MLTNDDRAAWYDLAMRHITNPGTAGVLARALATVCDPDTHVALVGELRAERGFRDECERQLQSWIERVNVAEAAVRAERTRTETLRAALRGLSDALFGSTLDPDAITNAIQAAGDALAASIEETLAPKNAPSKRSMTTTAAADEAWPMKSGAALPSGSV